MQSIVEICSFVGRTEEPGITGNRHALFTLDNKTELQSLKDWSYENPNSIACGVLFQGSDASLARDIHAEFFHRGYRIHFCGSGLVAVAAFLLDQTHLNNCHVQAQIGEVKLFKDNERYGFCIRPLLFSQLTESETWAGIIGGDYQQGFNVGGCNDYVILQLENETAIHTCQPDFDMLRRVSKRALIVTAASDEYDYVMRYFAPQYGVEEDTATGSANASLVKFWSLQGKQSPMLGYQSSPAGGLFFGALRGDKVALSGLVLRTRSFF